MERNSTEISITGISNIYYCRASKLPADAMRLAVFAGAYPLIPIEKEIQFFGAPKLTITSKREGSLIREEANLVFDTLETIPENEDLCFAIKTNSGFKLLIGTNEPDFPEISHEDTTGEKDSERSIIQYSINYKALKGSIPCIF